MATSGFFAIAATDPDRAALVDPDERRYTYGELAGVANRYARGLRQRGLRPGDTLALVMPNGVDLVTVYGGAVQVGLYVVVVNWHLTPDEIAYIIKDCDAGAAVVHERYADAAHPGLDAAGVDPARRFCVGSHSAYRPLAELGEGQSDADVDDRRAGLLMFYTSGTTGRPKGVRKIVDAVHPDEIGFTTGVGVARRPPDDTEVTIVGGPMYHGAPIASACMALDGGGLLVLMERWTPERWLELVERYRVTTTTMVPTMFHRLLALPAEVRDAADVSSLRSVMHSGAPCSIELKYRMLDWLGPIVSEGYSSTEGAGTMVTAEEWLARPGTVGRPSPGVTLRILDEEGNECPVGTPGIVFVSQALWRFEYLHDAAKTEANRRDGLFTVGDIGYVDDEGYLFLCDRQAEVIVSGGVNIYPAEAEARLLAHPAVGDVAVIGVPNEEWGEEVRAVVEVAPGVTPDGALGEELVQWCRDGLAHFKCPRRVDFVDALGRDPNGKVRKAQVRAPYWEGHARRI